ncbi:hypothetical protein [Aureispira anguillae]|uniref:Uncharacterized protein n=1 Tax=Aureispira anguillae TaxID=2864201 RepID=A0A915YDM9_9BACT|nr:hypothetical protein [Aureispira anguillae]BDS11158.1 hypothetical protein AsAng_0018690 [Aureispira anguillae]
MHTKVYINNYIASKIGLPKTPRDIEQIHKFFETYLKYIALTALRLKGAKYKEAKSYVSKSWIPCTEDQLRKLVLTLLNQRANNKQYWAQLLKKNQKLKILTELLFKYAAKIRNLTFHGNYYPFEEGEEELVYAIYIKMIEALEVLISKHKKGNKILKNTPTEFGAIRGHLIRKNQFKQILPFQPAGLPYAYSKAQQIYSTI